MLGTRHRLFPLLGVPISVDASWLVIFALLTLSLANAFPAMLHDYFPRTGAQPDSLTYWVMGLVTALAFFTCIVLHELGHALAARAQGIPIRGITLFLFGGVAELGDEPPSPGSEFWMAIAGPGVTVVLTALFWFGAVLGYYAGWPHPLVIVLAYLATINGIVLVFNLVPALPLDGGRVLRSILWKTSGSFRTATSWAARAGTFFAGCLIALGIVQFFASHWLAGVWTALIGLFLHNAAQRGYHQATLRQALRGEPVSRFMRPNPIVVPASIDLLQWVEDFLYRYDQTTFPVVSGDQLKGFIETRVLNRVPRSEWPNRSVSELMRTDIDALAISPETDALDALTKMLRSDLSCLVVTKGDDVLGTVCLHDLLRFLHLTLDLGEADDLGDALQMVARPRHERSAEPIGLPTARAGS
jgi:Zn-dependent protease/CBS domain-containing protein